MNRLKDLRNEKGLTLKEISKETHIKKATFSNYELGQTEPTLDTWIQLAKYFDVDPEYLVGWSDVRKR
ncbi:helix-turn-helix transcriptional regulator [Leuconostoc suionicum]|uniref:helix-turn-helix domain-containing protein n=1 Tax=Leuconostoc suionicum TaxID=1511761 RepID=UPI0024ACD667|nr:helix-turn-helix transcriptional regulator [Leuconostoc suionicum]MDI6503126.1 helix-turn-helix transcriptional regulator [Leuconostoc suionicum]MDI6666002.1 helix-turn-helix transcriptional regulator [Leuconostoc suionicum]